MWSGECSYADRTRYIPWMRVEGGPVVALRLATLVLLSTLAFMDFSLVVLYARGVLSPAHPLLLAFIALFFVSGPASWIVALSLREHPARVAAAILPVGFAAALYAAALASLLSRLLEGSLARLVAVPVGLVIALIGLFELMAEPGVRERLEAVYEKCLLSLQPYTLIMIAVIAVVFAASAPTPTAAAVGAAVYAAGLIASSRRCAARLGAAGLAGIAGVAGLYATLASWAHLCAWRLAAGAAMVAALPIAAVAARRASGRGPLCSVAPLLSATLAVFAATAPMVDPRSLVEALRVFLLAGAIGWGANIAVAYLGYSGRGALVKRLLAAPETRIAAGLALILVGLEAMGVPSSYATPVLIAGGFAAALLNEGLARGEGFRRSEARLPAKTGG